MRVKTTVSAHALIINQDPSNQNKQVLLARLAYRDHRWRRWCFPGGYVDEGEEVVDALCREVLEETGLRVKSFEQVAVTTQMELEQPNISFIFRCDHWSGEAAARSRELIEVAWVDESTFKAMAHEGGPLAYPAHMCRQVTALGWQISVREGATES